MSAFLMTGSTVTNTNCSKKIFFHLEDFYYYFAVVLLLMTKKYMPVVKTSDRNKLEVPPWAHPIDLLFDLNGTYNLVSICSLCRGGREGSLACPWSVPLLNF